MYSTRAWYTPLCVGLWCKQVVLCGVLSVVMEWIGGPGIDRISFILS